MDTKQKNNHSKGGKEPGTKFHSKNVKHDPQAESARAVFGLNREDTNKK